MMPSDELDLIVSELEQDGDALPAMLARMRDLTDRLREIEHSRNRCPPEWRGAGLRLVYDRETADA